MAEPKKLYIKVWEAKELANMDVDKGPDAKQDVYIRFVCGEDDENEASTKPIKGAGTEANFKGIITTLPFSSLKDWVTIELKDDDSEGVEQGTAQTIGKAKRAIHLEKVWKAGKKLKRAWYRLEKQGKYAGQVLLGCSFKEYKTIGPPDSTVVSTIVESTTVAAPADKSTLLAIERVRELLLQYESRYFTVLGNLPGKPDQSALFTNELKEQIINFFGSFKDEIQDLLENAMEEVKPLLKQQHELPVSPGESADLTLVLATLQTMTGQLEAVQRLVKSSESTLENVQGFVEQLNKESTTAEMRTLFQDQATSLRLLVEKSFKEQSDFLKKELTELFQQIPAHGESIGPAPAQGTKRWWRVFFSRGCKSADAGSPDKKSDKPADEPQLTLEMVLEHITNTTSALTKIQADLDSIVAKQSETLVAIQTLSSSLNPEILAEILAQVKKIDKEVQWGLLVEIAEGIKILQTSGMDNEMLNKILKGVEALGGGESQQLEILQQVARDLKILSEKLDQENLQQFFQDIFLNTMKEHGQAQVLILNDLASKLQILNDLASKLQKLQEGQVDPKVLQGLLAVVKQQKEAISLISKEVQVSKEATITEVLRSITILTELKALVEKQPMSEHLKKLIQAMAAQLATLRQMKVSLEAVVRQEDLAALQANITSVLQSMATLQSALEVALERKLEEKLGGLDGKLDAKLVGMDGKLDAKLVGMDGKLDAKLEGLDGKLDAKLVGFDAKLEGFDAKLSALLSAFGEQHSRISEAVNHFMRVVAQLQESLAASLLQFQQQQVEVQQQTGLAITTEMQRVRELIDERMKTIILEQKSEQKDQTSDILVGFDERIRLIMDLHRQELAKMRTPLERYKDLVVNMAEYMYNKPGCLCHHEHPNPQPPFVVGPTSIDVNIYQEERGLVDSTFVEVFDEATQTTTNIMATKLTRRDLITLIKAPAINGRPPGITLGRLILNCLSYGSCIDGLKHILKLIKSMVWGEIRARQNTSPSPNFPYNPHQFDHIEVLALPNSKINPHTKFRPASAIATRRSAPQLGDHIQVDAAVGGTKVKEVDMEGVVEGVVVQKRLYRAESASSTSASCTTASAVNINVNLNRSGEGQAQVEVDRPGTPGSLSESGNYTGFFHDLTFTIRCYLVKTDTLRALLRAACYQDMQVATYAVCILRGLCYRDEPAAELMVAVNTVEALTKVMRETFDEALLSELAGCLQNLSKAVRSCRGSMADHDGLLSRLLQLINNFNTHTLATSNARTTWGLVVKLAGCLRNLVRDNPAVQRRAVELGAIHAVAALISILDHPARDPELRQLDRTMRGHCVQVLWDLSTIKTTTVCNQILDSGALPSLLHLLKDDDKVLVNQSKACLANIADAHNQGRFNLNAISPEEFRRRVERLDAQVLSKFMTRRRGERFRSWLEVMEWLELDDETSMDVIAALIKKGAYV